MLSSLVKNWPPVPNQNTGTRTVHVHCPAVEPMTGLQEPNWWTGIRISGPQNHTAHIRIQSKNGSILPLDISEWTQSLNETHPLPFPLPAKMAREMDLELSVKIPGYESLASVCMTFSALSRPKHDRFIFVNQGKIIMHWNPLQSRWGTPTLGYPPTWNTLHTVVPSTSELFQAEEDKLMCVHSWND
jgi:hypothetical protein